MACDEAVFLFWLVLLLFAQDRDVFESRKRLKAATAEGLEQKLARHQRRAIAFNRCLFALSQRQV